MKIPAVLLLFLVAASAPEIRHFRYERPVETGPSGQTCAAVNPAVFAQAAPGLADLRLYSATAEIPYVLRMASPPSSSARQAAPLDLGRNGGQTVFDAVMPEGSYSDVELAIDAHEFIASVAVSGSHEQAARANGQTKLGSFTIFDLTRQKLGRSTVLHLPQSDFRYLHFRIDGPIAPENITGLTVGAQPAGEPKYQTVAASTQVTQKAHESVMQFDVPAHTPVDRVVFVPAAQPANFSRDVTVTVQPANPPVREERYQAYPETSSGNLLRLHRVEAGRRIDEERLSVDTPAVSFDGAAHWTVAVENGDDPPLKFDAVRLQMIERHVCFDAILGQTYTLYYGDSTLSAPQYDYARLFAAQTGAATAVLGPEQSNPAYEPRPDDRPFTERHPALLWSALGAVVLLLAAVALRSAKTLKA